MYYSPSTGFFYTSAIHGGKMPPDVTEITNARHAELMAGQSKGKIISADENGHPILIDPPSAPPYVPHQVSRAQGKVALIAAGLWPDVLAYVESMTDPTEKALVEVALNDTTHWRRDSPTMQVISTAMGITGEQMDELFIHASQIEL